MPSDTQEPSRAHASRAHDSNQNPVLRDIRRSRGRWRAFGFIALALALLALAARFTLERFSPESDYIALVAIEGVITTNPTRLAILNDLAEDERVMGVIVRINSPGGTTAGGEEIYEALTKLRQQKPVVSIINEMGASAAYMSAIATDRIFSRRLSIVGSIGVLFQHMDASGLMETIGIDFDKVASGPLKAEPDLDEALSGEVRASFQALVDDSFNWFVDIVSERRGLTRTATLVLSDGRIMNGRMALNVGLIDEFGGQNEAIAWLEGKELPKDLPIFKVFPRPQSFEDKFVSLLGSEAKSMLGLDFAGTVGPVSDGLVSYWQY